MPRNSNFVMSVAIAATCLAMPGASAANQYEWLRGGKAEQVTIRVSHGDLDLSDPADLETLRKRFHEAAFRTCNDNDRAPTQVELDRRSCMRDAKRRAISLISDARRHTGRQSAQRRAR